MSVAFEVDETVVVELELKLECVLLCRELLRIPGLTPLLWGWLLLSWL
jgi:hypothetical protein